MLAQSDFVEQVKAQNGIALQVRPASPADLEDLLKFLKAVKPGDLRFRFLGAVKPSEALARLLVDVDHRSREDLIAFDKRDGTVAATAMIADGHSPEFAEIAVLVRSDLKGQGIGWSMLNHACDYARSRGYKRAECVESSSNERAIKLEEEQGFTAQLDPQDASLTILTRSLV